jgi:hypothetical protein
MTTDNSEYRAQLLDAARRIQAEQGEWEAAFRVFMRSHLGLAPGTVCDQAEAIISRLNNVKELSDSQLSLVVHFDSGCPPGYLLSEEQIEMAARALLPAAPL